MRERTIFDWLNSQTFVERLGWVLVHSLWQFALLALLAGMTVRAMRRSSAPARYAVLLVAMAVTVAVPAATWIFLPIDTVERDTSQGPAVREQPIEQVGGPSTLSNGNPVSASDAYVEARTPAFPASSVSPLPPPVSSIKSSVSTQPGPSWSQRIVIHRPWPAWIVAGWILGIVVCSLRPLLGWYTLRRLRCAGLTPASAEVRAALCRASERFGLNRAVRVMQSTLTRVPVVVGYVLPLILLPVGLVTSIPVGQLEAILAHELAHVRRRDFVVNLLQTLVETLFFYHPGVWWLSRRIRVEREHCCDDLVVSLLGNRVEYGRALVAIEEIRGRNAALALAASDGSLLNRVRRIAGVEAKRNPMSAAGGWAAALLGLALVGVTCIVLMNRQIMAGDESVRNTEPANKIATELDESVNNDAGDAGRIVAKLPRGLRIELVGVSTLPRQFPPNDKRAWWKADGSSLEKPPFREAINVSQETNSDGHEIAIQISAAADMPSLTMQLPCVSWHGRFSTREGEFHALTEYTSELTATTLRIGLATEPWTTWQCDLNGKPLNNPVLNDTLKELGPALGILRAGLSEKKAAIWVPNIGHSELRDIFAYKVLAVDKKGKAHYARHMHSDGKQERSEFDVPLTEFDHFEYSARPYRHWVTFENISLKAGQKSDVKVTIESLPDTPARLRVRNEDGSAAQFNNVVLAYVGFPKLPQASLAAVPTSDGVVSLVKLPAGTHWILAAGASEQRTLYEVKIPADQPVLERKLRSDAHWNGKNIDVKSSVEREGKDGEVIILDIVNKTNAALSVSEQDLQMTTLSYRGQSPRWPKADFVPVKIEAGQTGRLRLKWREWVRKGLWSSRSHEDIEEKGPPPAVPGKLWVRVSLGNIGALPVSVTDPKALLSEPEPKPSAALGDDKPAKAAKAIAKERAADK